MILDDDDASEEDRRAYLACLSALPFTPLGPPDWRDCGRATFSTTYGDGRFASLGLSHQRLAEPVVEHLSVDVGEAHAQNLANVLSSLVRSLTVSRGSSPSPATNLDLLVDGDVRPFMFVEMSDGDWVAAGHWEDELVTLSGTPWDRAALELVRVDPLLYVEDTLLRHWR